MRMHTYIVRGIVEGVDIDYWIVDLQSIVIFNVINSNNITVTSLINTFLNCGSSVFAENYRYIMYNYKVQSTLWRSDFKTLISNISYTDDINYWQRIKYIYTARIV